MNRRIAQLFRLIAQYLFAQGIAFKPQAYERAAQTLETWTQDVADVYRRGGAEALQEIPGIGVALAGKIEEYIKTNTIAELERLKKKFPFDMERLAAIEGIGPKTALKLYRALRIKTVADLERALSRHKLEKLKGFGKKSQDKIATHVAFSKQGTGRFLLGAIYDDASIIRKRLMRVPGTHDVVIAGSVRRMKETVRDMDMLATSDAPKKLMDYFVTLPGVVEIYAKGPTKSSVRLESGIDVDVRVIPQESWGAALNYFTGSKEHNVALREIAIKKGWKLNEYGLWKSARGKDVMVAGRTEQEIYAKLGMAYIEPEMRENRGEIALAQQGALPGLVGIADVRGDLQMHSDWSDGENSIEEMAKQAITLGYAYIAITDHTKSLGIARGMDEKTIQRQFASIDALNKKLKGKIRILKGLEVNILKNGLLDIPDAILAKCDVVGVAVHSHFAMSKDDMTARVVRAMHNPHADIVFHPTGRLLLRREGYELDFDAIFTHARKTKTVIEIDAQPDRLDVDDAIARTGKQYGVSFSIGTDSHSVHQLDAMRFGIGQARRGWLEKRDIINTVSLPHLLAIFGKT